MKLHWKNIFFWLPLLVLILVFGVDLNEAEGKRKRRYSPPLKIIDITTSPMPYAPGSKPLTIAVEVELPKNLKGDDLLEVSSLISFPTKRSIRFLSSRQPVTNSTQQNGKPRVNTILLWDGTDQTDQIVIAGTYDYEIRAKILANADEGLKTKMVSLRARGTLEISNPAEVEIPTLPPLPRVEHVPFTSEETNPEELGTEETEETEEQEGALTEEEKKSIDSGDTIEMEEAGEISSIPTEN